MRDNTMKCAKKKETRLTDVSICFNDVIGVFNFLRVKKLCSNLKREPTFNFFWNEICANVFDYVSNTHVRFFQ